ncbi:ADP-ribosyl cyclase/cyclic ADP-ribose hydrolase-like [Haliotis rufescens]|uniref:ADP-ribosyl cyclase/cyclic ADP-ribose hydrolase-like n=1 Tax=Haliotis rufescens TaxID=6454 RepID=UPI00201F0144|nr:ADP-ribosyl cyclase/cyclic ADP-ribose hydrolase-like [Haliotis rufescens]
MSRKMWSEDLCWLMHAVFPIILMCTLLPHLARGQCVPPGSTPGLRELVLGRCTEYQATVNPAQFCDKDHQRKNCTEITDKFVAAFSYQPACNVSFGRYDNFIKSAHGDVSRGKAMFWSDVYGVVQQYTYRGRRAIAIEDTLIGYIGDGLRFCAQESSPGITYNQECPGFDQTEGCPYNAEFSFWAQASSNFASSASGEVNLMLNASLAEAFYNTSFFGVWELPNLNSSKVTKVTVLLVHIPGQTVRSKCSTENIASLQRRLRERNIVSDCVDGPRGPQAMLCVDYPDEEECKVRASTSGASLNSDAVMGLAICICVISFVLS